jgi:inhibitor of KinA
VSLSKGESPTAVPAGDAALLVTFGDSVDPGVNARVRAVAAALEGRHAPGVIEATIAVATLLVHYDPLATGYEAVRDLVLDLAGETPADIEQESRLRSIPTVFGGAYGPDLPEVAQLLRMSEEEVLRQFTEPTYIVYMIGFSPGNAYLGGLPAQLALPRLLSPRERVPAGTVALAHQVNIYSVTSPGGWRWLGRTPLKMFDPQAESPTLLEAGDRVRFVPVSEEEYLRMGGEREE